MLRDGVAGSHGNERGVRDIMATHGVLSVVASRSPAIVAEPIGPVSQFADADAQERCEAIWALGTTRSPAVVPALHHALSDQDAEVRREAVWALARIGDTTTLSALQEALRDRDPEVRGMASEAIRSIRQKPERNAEGMCGSGHGT